MLIKGKQELLGICLITDPDERVRAVSNWLQRRVRDYHCLITTDLEMKNNMTKIDYESYLNHQKKDAAVRIAFMMLKDKMILCNEIAPSEREQDDKFKWWHHEIRHKLDCYAFFNLY